MGKSELHQRWIFTWNADNDGNLPEVELVEKILNEITREGVFQLERGSETGRSHYQGRFRLNRERTGKKWLLNKFSEIYTTINLTFIPEMVYDSSSYCTKNDSRLLGPFWVGAGSYREFKKVSTLKLMKWQQQFVDMITNPEYQPALKDRKVMVVSNPAGKIGKSKLLKHLAQSQEANKLKVAKLPIDKPDRLRAGVIKLLRKQEIDLFMFDFTRTQGVETHLENLFEIVEEIKNGYLVDCMYGNYSYALFPPPMIVIFTNREFGELHPYLSPDRWFSMHVRNMEDDLKYWKLCGKHSDDTFMYEGDHKLLKNELERLSNEFQFK